MLTALPTVMLKTTPRRAAQRAVAVALLMWFATAAHGAGAIENQTLRYAVSYDGRNAGEIEIVIRAENDGYLVTSTAKPSLLASLFVKAHTSTTRFVRHRGEVALDSGTESLAGDDTQGTVRGFHFDRSRSRIEFSNGKHAAIQPGDQFEAAAFPLLLMLRPVERIAGARVRVVSFKRIRDYLYEAPVEAVVTVPAGAFSSWKINRHRIGRPADTVTVWLNKTGAPVPVKITVKKKGRTSILRLSGRT